MYFFIIFYFLWYLLIILLLSIRIVIIIKLQSRQITRRGRYKYDNENTKFSLWPAVKNITVTITDIIYIYVYNILSSVIFLNKILKKITIITAYYLISFLKNSINFHLFNRYVGKVMHVSRIFIIYSVFEKLCIYLFFFIIAFSFMHERHGTFRPNRWKQPLSGLSM